MERNQEINKRRLILTMMYVCSLQLTFGLLFHEFQWPVPDAGLLGVFTGTCLGGMIFLAIRFVNQIKDLKKQLKRKKNAG